MLHVGILFHTPLIYNIVTRLREANESKSVERSYNNEQLHEDCVQH
jgi:hypothetical protein